MLTNQKLMDAMIRQKTMNLFEDIKLRCMAYIELGYGFKPITPEALAQARQQYVTHSASLKGIRMTHEYDHPHLHL